MDLLLHYYSRPPPHDYCVQIPRSVLVVIHTPDLQVLMMARAGWQGFWQSVTGSLAHESEPLRDAAIREVREENRPGRGPLRSARLGHREPLRDLQEAPRAASRLGSPTTSSTSSAWRYPSRFPSRSDPAEHLSYKWLPWREAAALTLS